MTDMKIKNYITRISLRVLTAAMAILSFLTFPSCNSVIYDYEGDCSVTYRLRFRYDRNLKRADAFASEVKSVHLYAFDNDGILVWQKSENGQALSSEGYSMTLDLPAGDYQLIAWCGLDNVGGKKSFSVPEMTAGVSRMEELQCSLKRSHTDSRASGDVSTSGHSTEMLDFMFHGMLEVNLPKNDDGGEYEYTMYLTKDTNHIRIILQHLSAQDVDVDDFVFRIEDENGLMAHDNSLMEDENIVYHTWNTQSGTAAIVKDGETVDCVTAVADLTVARMTVEHSRRMMLTITDREGKTVVSGVPVIDYALLARDYYETAYGYEMSPQDFLDREDEYVMTFFLDENNRWISSHIMIQSWRIVLRDVDIK